GYTTGEAVVDAWMGNDSHRAILLGPAEHIGVGYAEADDDLGTYWTADLGANDTYDGPADGCHPDI
ncbi:MAG: CAP domain-containing protein, partial [Gemmatimonadota bacterium]